MFRSMTGYGQGSTETRGLRVTAELRSVNNRFVDIRLRVPPELAAREGQIRRRMLARIRRGRVELKLDLGGTRGGPPALAVNRPLVEAVTAAARSIREEFGVRGSLDLPTLISLPGILQASDAAGGLELAEQDVVDRALDLALEALDAERCREGETLRADLLQRVGRMEDLMVEVRERASAMPRLLHRKLVERLEALGGSVELDPARVAQEAAFLADRCDVTEELVRLEGHLEQLRSLLTEPDGEPVGRRLDFLVQELYREANTLDGKSADLELTRRALALKAEIEKVREQVQNLE